MGSAEKAALLGQALAARNVIDGLIASLQEEGEPTVSACEHPLEQRKYSGSMGSDVAFTCGACNETVRPERTNQE